MHAGTPQHALLGALARLPSLGQDYFDVWGNNMRQVLLVLLCAAFATPAFADPLEDLDSWHTVLALDDLCKVLKYSERAQVDRFIGEVLAKTNQYADQRDGRITEADYFTWYDGVRAKAGSGAARMGCTGAAEPYFSTARHQASAAIYQGLYLSALFDRAPDEDLWGIPLNSEELDALTRYDVLLQKIYGAQFPAFADTVKGLTSALLPTSVDLTLLEEWGFGLVPDEDTEKLWAAQALATGVMRNVYFEVTAELNFWRVLPTTVQPGSSMPSLVLPNDATDPHVIWYGPETVSTENGEKVNLIVTRTSDSHIRVMTYGESARIALENGVARLYVLTTPQSEDVSRWELLSKPEWPELLTAFEGVRIYSPCLGGPCFEFPPEASDAILSGGKTDFSELFLAGDAASQPDFTKPAFQRGVISNLPMWTAAGW
jgi:hypothetical protein